MCAMSHDQRRNLLEHLQRLASDADDIRHDITKIFLPLPRHNLALREQIMVIRGERGTGKTALFHFLSQMKDRGADLDTLYPESRVADARWIEGFSESETRHPPTSVLDSFAGQISNESLRVFWMTHLACCLAEDGIGSAEIPEPVWQAWKKNISQPEHWVATAHRHIGELTQWVDNVDRALEQTGQTVFVTYDHLDKIGLFTPDIRERYAGTLLALWLSLSNRYRRLRAKIFIREDLFEAAQRSFADASKLKPRSISLDWDTESLYRVLIRHMAALSEEMREWIQDTGKRITLNHRPPWGWMPPDSLPETGRESQKSFVDHLAGEQMGKGLKKGYTYRWIPNHLQDAHVRIVPRSLLNLIGYAAAIACQHTPRARYDRLLHPSELLAALEETSRQRVIELAEEHKVVARIENLRGSTLLLDPSLVKRKLAKPRTEHPDDFGDDGARVMDELIRLGVLKVRPDGRIDVPDIYRYGYGIKRKGGVPKPR